MGHRRRSKKPPTWSAVRFLPFFRPTHLRHPKTVNGMTNPMRDSLRRRAARRLLCLGLGSLAAVSAACSGPTSPAPTIAGTWHVTVQSVDSGTLTPTTFTVLITPATESTFTVTMPPIVWSEGPVSYDTLPKITRFQDDSPDSTLAFEEWCRTLKCVLTFRARMNQGRDTLTSGSLLFWDTVTVNNTLWLQTIPGAGGRFVARK